MGAVVELVMWKYGPVFSERVQKCDLPSHLFLPTLRRKEGEEKFKWLMRTPMRAHTRNIRRVLEPTCPAPQIQNAVLSLQYFSTFHQGVRWRCCLQPATIFTAWLEIHFVYMTVSPPIWLAVLFREGGGRGLAYHYERLHNSDVGNEV